MRNQPLLPPMAEANPTIQINWAPYRLTNVPKIDMISGGILTKHSSIVFFGEANFTFTTAFAAFLKKQHRELEHSVHCEKKLRAITLATDDGKQLEVSDNNIVEKVERLNNDNPFIPNLANPWQWIIATRLENISPFFPLPEFDSIRSIAIDFANKNGKRLGASSKEVSEKKEELINLNPPPHDCFRFGVDVTNLPPGSDFTGKAVWFQCPWTTEWETRYNTASLVEQYFHNVAIKNAEYIVIGISNYYGHSQHYGLGKLLHLPPQVVIPTFAPTFAPNSFYQSYGYEFLSADEQLVREILQYGYKHETSKGDKDIHDKIIHCHISLVFRRQRQ